jgi:hypothetical protein
MERAAEIIATADRMRADRTPVEATWQAIRSYIIPEASDVLRDSARTGAENRQNVVDNTGEQAHELLAAALVTILVPSIIDWVKIELDDPRLNEDDEVSGWLETSTAITLSFLRQPRSGFAACQHEKYQDVVGFGQGGGMVRDVPGHGLRITSVPLAQLLLAENADGEVDTIYRDFELRAEQAFRRWGRAAGEQVTRAATAANGAERDRKFRFVHAVAPNAHFDPGSSRRDARAFVSCYVNVTERTEVEADGYYTMPYQAPRWRKRAEDVYGRGPGHVALSDVKMLQREAIVTIRAGERNLDPALLVPDDGVLTSPVRTGNGRLVYFRSQFGMNGPPVFAMPGGGDPRIGEEMMQSARERIGAAFFKSIVQMIRKDRMTATEVLEVIEEGQRIMGPYIGRLQAEDLGPLIERSFDVLQRGGAFPPVPAAAQGRGIRAVYTSPAAMQQRIAQARGLAQFAEITTPFRAIRPDLDDNLDLDLAYRDTATTLGLPRRWLRPSGQVERTRTARAEAARGEQERQATLETVDTVANAVRAAPALSQALQSPTEAIGA